LKHRRILSEMSEPHLLETCHEFNDIQILFIDMLRGFRGFPNGRRMPHINIDRQGSWFLSARPATSVHNVTCMPDKDYGMDRAPEPSMCKHMKT
jgi:hypothetical protein